MIPRFKPYLKMRDLRYLFKQSRDIHESFETYFAELTGSRFALLLPYGRSALYFFLKSHQIENQEIVLPAYNCQSVIGPILETQNIPVFVDSKDDDFNMDEQKLDGVITDKTKVVMPSAMYGSPLNTDYYKQLRGKGIYLIGDYALGLLTFLTGDKQKVLDTFDMSFFSFGMGKEVTFVSGGVAVTNDEALYRKLKASRDAYCKPSNLKHQLKILLKFLGACILFKPLLYGALYFISEKTHFLDKEKGLTIGIKDNLPNHFEYLPTPFQVHIALDRLSNIDEFIQEKAERLSYYFKRLKGRQWAHLHLPCDLPTYSHLPVLLERNKQQDLLEFFLANHMHTTVMFKAALNVFYDPTRTMHYENAERYAETIVLLPLHRAMRDHTIDRTLEVLEKWSALDCTQKN